MILGHSKEIAKLQFVNQQLSSDLEVQARINNLVYAAIENLSYTKNDYGLQDQIDELKELLAR